jgi:hypothetical protein
MSLANPKYDVAISFLSQDEPIAAALRDRLTEGLAVFFYPRCQEELAGTDGLESMRMPFTDESRVNVVLYRERWGQTPWTRVEETAIKDRCFAHGWDSLFFITLDDTSAIPKWLPPTHVRLNFSNFGLEQAVGAIKNSVERCGGIASPMTASRHAAIYAEDVKYNKDRQALLDSYQGMENVKREVRVIFTEIKNLCEEIKKNNGISIGVSTRESPVLLCVLTDNRISLTLSWYQPISNMAKGAMLRVGEFNANINNQWIVGGEPSLIGEIHLLPELSRARTYCWVDESKKAVQLSATEVANKCVMKFLGLAKRADQGEITNPLAKLGMKIKNMKSGLY